MAQAGKLLEQEGCEVLDLHSLEELKKEMQGRGVHLIVSRICPCCREWEELLSRAERNQEFPPVVLLASGFEVDLYLEAMRRGAFDSIGLPLNENELLRVAASALRPRKPREISNTGVLQ
jgi:DNA-binding NtrC family response regulator